MTLQLFLWVCVSDNFDVGLLAQSIFEAATKENKNGSVTHGTSSPLDRFQQEVEKSSPLDRLQQQVSGKRYLLVLDDIWNRDIGQWVKLKSSLQHGGIGSCVLTTTSDEKIAQLMGTTEACKLKLLDQSFIEEIIRTNAFDLEKESPKELVAMVGDMAKKCAGSPLAATALRSLLRTKTSIEDTNTSVEEWKVVLRRRTICDETGILPILKLSYNELPSQMRQCFSFCAMFPKDYEIDRDILIQLWMANGFITIEQGVCPEIRGSRFFAELVSRSFFQETRNDPIDHGLFIRTPFRYGTRVTCQMQDLMHDVAQSAMEKECATITDKPSTSEDLPYSSPLSLSKSEDLPYSTRHLFVSHEDPKTVLRGFLEKSSPTLQTLLCTTGYTDEVLQLLSNYNSIRALHIKEKVSFMKPKYLHHLKYLDLSDSDIVALPEDISILYHLQTLRLSSCHRLAKLPKEMKYMTALRHLYIDGCPMLKMMPPELRCLASLQTLTCFVAGTTDSSCSNVGELQLLDLGGQLEVRQLENVTESDAQTANLENKKRLAKLRLAWSDGSSREPQDHTGGSQAP
jgi:hypothetical protein